MNFIPLSVSEAMRRAIERLLEMPSGVALMLMWVGGAALLGLCALIVYWAAVFAGMFGGVIF